MVEYLPYFQFDVLYVLDDILEELHLPIFGDHELDLVLNDVLVEEGCRRREREEGDYQGNHVVLDQEDTEGVAKDDLPAGLHDLGELGNGVFDLLAVGLGLEERLPGRS